MSLSSCSRKILCLLAGTLLCLALALSFYHTQVAHALPTDASVTTYPGPAGIAASDQYAVTVNGTPSFVYKSVSQRGDGYLASWTDFAFSGGSVTIQVTKLSGTASSVIVRPLNDNISATLSGNTATFTVANPSKLSVEFNGDLTNTMFIFADAPEVNPPSPGDPNVIYYGPGLYNIGTISIPSGDTLYIAGGAYVEGQIKNVGTTNTKILGRGILSGENYAHMDGRGNGLINFTNSNGITIDGITLVDSPGYQIGSFGWQDSTIFLDPSYTNTYNNIKEIGWYVNTDGIHPGFKSTINDMFIFNDDDAIAPIEDAKQSTTVTNCVIWTHQYGAAIDLGYGDFQGEYASVNNVSVIHAGTAQPVIHMDSTQHAHVHNITIQNLRVEDFPTGNTAFLGLQVAQNIYSLDPNDPVGSAQGIFLNNIQIDPPSTSGNYIEGYDTNSTISDVTLENVTVGGHLLTNAAQANLTLNQYTSNIRFAAPGALAPPMPVDLAYNKTATASSTGAVGQGPANAVDETAHTKWSSQLGETSWLQVDLGQQYPINRYVVVHANPYENWQTQSLDTRDFQFQVSNDTQNWTTLDTVTGNTLDATNHVVNSQGTWRYVRLYITNPQTESTNRGARIYDFEVYGPSSAYASSSGWNDLGCCTSNSPAISSQGPNELNAFVTGTGVDAGNLFQKTWNGSSWSNWTYVAAGPGGGIVGSPAVVSWGNGRIDVVVTASNQHVYHLAYSNGSWASSWDDLGCCTSNSPAISSQGANELDVFVTGNGGSPGNLYQQTWNGSSWSGWTEVNTGPSGGIQGSPAAVSWGNGRIDVVATGSNQHVYHLAYSNGSWASSWDDLGCCAGTSPTIVSEGVNGLDVFVTGTGSVAGAFFQQTWNGNSWNGWTYLNGGPSGGIQGSPSAVAWGVGQISVVAHGGGSEIYYLSE